jgi:nitrite reductase (NADH) small subunit
MKHALFPADELQPGEMRSVTVGKTAILIIRTEDDRWRALRNSCPHFGADLSEGVVEQMVVSDEVGDYHLSDTEFVVRCPWHGFEFNIDTGRCPADPDRQRVRAYAVAVEAGVVVVER